MKDKEYPPPILQNVDFDILCPFGPTLGKLKMSDDLVGYLLTGMDKSQTDHGHKLAGRIEHQPKFLEHTAQKVLKELVSGILQYFIDTIRINSHGLYKVQGEHELLFLTGWFVDQVAGEYNPRHHHTQCSLSCVGYLELPASISAPEDPNCLDGCIEFSYGDPQELSSHVFYIRPKVGDFYVFPSFLNHCVAPFKGEGRRKSFSMNMAVAPIQKEGGNDAQTIERKD